MSALDFWRMGVPIFATGQMRVHEFKNVIKKICHNLEPCFPELLENVFQMAFP